eukprot:COSAG01_NODE_159_length_23702_cov_119.507585_26_plen_73_part_00
MLGLHLASTVAGRESSLEARGLLPPYLFDKFFAVERESARWTRSDVVLAQPGSERRASATATSAITDEYFGA